jgi:hypothetical protein
MSVKNGESPTHCTNQEKSNMVRLLAAIAIAFAAWTAGYPAAAQEIDAEELALAGQILTASRAGRPFDKILPNLADQAKTTFIRSNPQMQLGIIEVVDKVALDLVSRREDLDARLTEVWALTFDKDELRTLLDFYNTPAGKKFGALMPRLLSAQMGVAENWSRELSQEMHQRVSEELTAMNKAEAKRLEAGPGGATGSAGGGLKLQPQ